MLTLNKIMLVGRLTDTPILKTTQSGIAVTSFTLAVDRGYAKPGEEKQTDFINIVCWRTQAEFATKYFKKGDGVYICGSLQIRKWKDKDGNARTTAEVVADEVKFAESKQSTPNGESGEKDPLKPKIDDRGFVELDPEEELPF